MLNKKGLWLVVFVHLMSLLIDVVIDVVFFCAGSSWRFSSARRKLNIAATGPTTGLTRATRVVVLHPFMEESKIAVQSGAPRRQPLLRRHTLGRAFAAGGLPTETETVKPSFGILAK
jgi:hypothetical protein